MPRVRAVQAMKPDDEFLDPPDGDEHDEEEAEARGARYEDWLGGIAG